MMRQQTDVREHFSLRQYEVSALSRQTIDRRAAFASIVEASTPILSPFTRPRSATSFKTKSNTFS